MLNSRKRRRSMVNKFLARPIKVKLFYAQVVPGAYSRTLRYLWKPHNPTSTREKLFYIVSSTSALACRHYVPYVKLNRPAHPGASNLKAVLKWYSILSDGAS